MGFTPKSSILIGFSIIKHPFWGTIILGNPQVVDKKDVDSTTRRCFFVNVDGCASALICLPLEV